MKAIRRKGEQVLGDLIVYLRAALPHLRHSTSTLGQELDLVRAYIDIMRVKLGDGLVFHFDLSNATRSTPMPPMLLLPLIDHVLAHHPKAHPVHRTIGVTAGIGAGKLRVEIVDSGQSFAADSLR